MTKRIFQVLILLFFISSCEKENRPDCFTSTGKETTESRILGGFTKIHMDDGINVFITESAQRSVAVTGGSNLLDNVITEVKDGILNIKNRNKCNWVRSFKRDINVYINIDSLDEIQHSGSGNIDILNTLKSSRFIINMLQSSGNINLNLEGNYVELKIHTGPAKVTATGNANELIIYNSSPGIIDAQDFTCQKALAINRNTGRLYVNASNTLKAEIFGSGNIYYIGSPTIDLAIYGDGKLVSF